MQKIKLKIQFELEPLAFSKITIFDNIMRAFFQFFSNINVQKKAIKYFTMFHAFL